MSKYNKLWVALGGAIVTICTVLWGDAIGAKAQQIVNIAVPLLTAFGVYQVANSD